MSVVPHQSSLVPEPEPGLVGMLERLATNPDVTVDKLERLLALQERILGKQAEDEFNVAMSTAQSEMGRISTDLKNPQTNSRYASYGKLDRTIRPIYTKHGFALSFGTAQAPTPETIRVTCHVSHRGGHGRDYFIDMPADGKGAKGGDVMTRTHATGAAASYGMRYLLKMIFNVAIGEDDKDGNAPEVKKITESQAADVEALIEEVNANKAGFLKFYKIEKVADLAASDLASAVAELNRKRK
jgi:hypothetical protein